ncbi:nuclear transport factor 2 family protein [Thiohalophilus thiocyanatoxydans]|uniref:Ketosteroid isomerase-like protein n=1 Tax=Thiohalophilus thiocyanatoxydans TaxID=381308 RepID=A0A4V3H3X2_9GAMM|nr:nuclear transport factor 2 family protein [Thiohalophilus thiocyanatoxydans]TDY00975.1 ketosteroid isomerase-like protein [Thiohalophilus thiocyanatoxydans]
MSSTDFVTSTEAENAFYTAFSRGDLAAMRGIWLDASHTSCVHPMGDRLLGTPAIIKSWETILKNTGDVIIELSDIAIHQGRQTAIHTLIENIHVQDETEKVFQFVVTNVYEQTPAGWKMILHHASPMPRDLSQEKEPAPVVH